MKIVICDDSSFARKQIQRALPGDWAVEVTFATNGEEGLNAVRAGLADLLFLDLTMPVMDGLEVLRAIRKEALNTLVIVVSADIQPKVREEVQHLGALAFLQKPVQNDLLLETLKGYGLIREVGEAVIPDDVAVDLRDWLKELFNVAMGKTADRLSSVWQHGIDISIPKISRMDGNEVQSMIHGLSQQESLSIMSQGFIGGGIAGECLLSMNQQQTDLLVTLLAGHTEESEAVDLELLLDLSGILNGTLLRTLFKQLDLDYHSAQPVLLHNLSKEEITNDQLSGQLLVIDIAYAIKSEAFRCDQVLIFTPQAGERLNEIAQLATG